MNGCCQDCGKRKCCCRLAENTYKFFGNCKQSATSKCILPYVEGTPTRVTVNEGLIYSMDSADKANCLAKELAQIRANRYIKCQEQCYHVICVEAIVNEEEFQYVGSIGQITNAFGFVGFIRENSVQYKFTVIRSCGEGQVLQIVGYEDEFTSLYDELLLEEGETITIPSMNMDRAITSFIYLPNGVDDPPNNYNLIDSKNLDGGKYIYPGINCNYEGTNLVSGQAYGCGDLPCGVGIPYILPT